MLRPSRFALAVVAALACARHAPSAFRDAGSTRPGIAFDRPSWPHGATGNAVPHGTVFGW